MYVRRDLERFIKTASEQFPVLLVTGARQVGKTTMLRHLAEAKRSYVTLDDPLILKLARTEPALFIQRFPPPVLIDEIQYAPDILPHIKMEADKSGGRGLYWLTGSQPFHLMKGVSESLAGRIGVVQLMGISQQESLATKKFSDPFLPIPKTIKIRVNDGKSFSLQELYTRIWRGSFPAVVLDERMDRDLFYASYVQTYLQRDIRDLAKVGDEIAFFRFLRATAARTGQLLNLAELARDADVSPNTAKNWLSILMTSGIVYLLEPYHHNVSKRLVKRPKLYFLDTGLCSYLTEWLTPMTLEAGAMSGAILETWIFSEILKGYWHNGRRAPFYYYRDKDQKEIDLIISQDGVIYPLEFKKTALPTQNDVRHFKTLTRLKTPVGPGGVICLAPAALPLGNSIFIIPVSAI
ncbi:MAG: ATP-binding protein [Candidatus Aminicenantes bacterium]|nr:ATP-binding protein [Candidatus Aminicenantes bacterium]